MSGSNEGNEGNEGNSGSLGRGGGGSFGVLPDRVDLPFVTLGDIAQKRLPRTGWRGRDWAGDKAAVLTLVDFAQLGALIPTQPSPPSANPATGAGNVGNGTLSAVGVQPFSWQVGDYTLECVDAADNGTFVLRDPQGRLLRRFTIGTGNSVTVRREVVFTLTKGSQGFQPNDAFIISVSPGTTKLWLEPPFIFRAGLPVRVPPPRAGANTGDGSCETDRRSPALPGVMMGIYTLACTAVDGPTIEAIFDLTAPDGTTVGTYRLPATPGARLVIADQVHCTLTAGTKRFDVNDGFTITVEPRPKPLVITPRPAGNQGIGTCTPDAVPQSGARIGIYTLRCTRRATIVSGKFHVGARFELLDPDGDAVAGSPFTLSTGGTESTFPSTSPPFFTLKDGDPTRESTLFQVGDGFDLDVGGFLDMELDDLVRAAEDERSDALGEIVAQNDGFISYFLAAMTISPKSHPRTCLLLQIGSMVGAYVSMHFKGVYQRARPTQTAPALLSPVPVPGHPAYPSGHSTQAHLMMRCVLAGMPAELRGQFRPVLRALADRIARNREIAGLHFPSDSAAGAALADRIFAILNSDDMPKTLPQSIPPETAAGTVRRFKSILAEARSEWQ